MTSEGNEREQPSPPDDAGDGMNLLIGWRAGGEKAAGEPEPDRSAEEPAESAAAPGSPSAMHAQSDEPGTEAIAGPIRDPAATMADLAAGQRRILALLEELTPKHDAAATGDAGTDLEEAVRSIAAATEWASDIRAAMDSLLVTAGKSIRDLEKAERGLGTEAAALKTRAEGIDGQIVALGSGARTLGTRLKELDQARRNLDARSAELQAVKQEIAKYYREWTAGAVRRSRSCGPCVRNTRSASTSCAGTLSKAAFGAGSEKQKREGASNARASLPENEERHDPPASERVRPCCGEPYVANGSHESPVMEIEVKHPHDRSWTLAPGLSVSGSPREVTAPPALRLFPRIPYGISVWERVLYACFRPLRRVSRWMEEQGLPMAPGTMAGAMKSLAPMFAPLASAILDHHNTMTVRHGDETSSRPPGARNGPGCGTRSAPTLSSSTSTRHAAPRWQRGCSAPPGSPSSLSATATAPTESWRANSPAR